MVVTYHVWLGRVSGGVDIFLLISAFLLTLSFVRKVESGSPLKLVSHWLHLFKRLLPAAVVVILGVLIGHVGHPAPKPLAGRPGPGVGLPALPAELAARGLGR